MKKKILLVLTTVLMLCGISVSVYADEAVLVPESSGTVILPMIPGGIIKPAAKGDLNVDGVVDQKDVDLFTKYFAGWKISEGDIRLSAGDVNGDGEVTRADAMELAREVAGWTYTVTFDANGSDVENLPAAQKVKAGGCAVEPEKPTRLIHKFAGWYTDSECTKPFSFTTKITGNITLYAKWDIEIYSKLLDESHVKTGILEYEGVEYEGQYIDNELIVVAKDGVSREFLEQLMGPYGGTIVGQIPTAGHYQIEFISTMTAGELTVLASQLMNNENINNVYTNVVNEYSSLGSIDGSGYTNVIFNNYDNPNDNSLRTYYHLNTPVPLNGYDVRNWGLTYTNVYKARECLKNNKEKVKVGIIDTMFSVIHEDVVFTEVFIGGSTDGNDIAINPLAINTQDKDLYSHYAHGTCVAGVIGAKNDSIGISGVADNTELYGFSMHSSNDNQYDLTTKFTSSTFEDETALAVLLETGCQIINYSAGYEVEESGAQRTKSQIKKVKKQGEEIYDLLCKYEDSAHKFLIITSAGNKAIDAQYQNAFTYIITREGNNQIKDNIIVVSSVAPTSANGSIYLFNGATNIEISSNVCFNEAHNNGSCIELLAPGVNILSTVPKTNNNGLAQSGYMLTSGTSLASPIVAGIATLVWQANPALNAAEVKKILIDTANPCVDTKGYNVTNKMVNAEAAVIKALGYDPRTQEIALKFIDTATNSNLTCNDVTANIISYLGYDIDILDSYDLDLIHMIHTDDPTKNYSGSHIILSYGIYEIKFSADGYRDTVFEWTDIQDAEFVVNENTVEYTIYMTPEGGVPPVVEETHTLRVKFVDSETGQQIPLTDLFGDISQAFMPEFFLSNEKLGKSTVTVQGICDITANEVVFAVEEASPDYYLWLHQSFLYYNDSDEIQSGYIWNRENTDDLIHISGVVAKNFTLVRKSLVVGDVEVTP